MSHGSWRRGTVFFAVLTVLTLLVALLWPTSKKKDAAPAASKSSGIVVMSGGTGCDKDVVAEKAMVAKGFSPSDLFVGVDQIEWSAPAANERGSAAFANETPADAEALVKELRSDTDKAKAALNALMDESGATPEQLLTSTNWTPVQFKVDSAWDGNTAYSSGKAVPAGTRTSSSGDVVWLFVKPAECVKATAGEIPAVEAVVAHRAGCGNPQTELPRPVTPAPPITTPTGEIGKDHRLAPWSPEVVHCPPGQIMDRYTEVCIPWPPATTSTTTPGGSGQGDSGDGATNTTQPPTTAAPPVTLPNTVPPTVPPTPPTIPSF